MIYGYLRVSTDDQDVNSQRQGVEDFAKRHGWTIEKYISDEGVSGGKDPDKRNLGPLLKLLKKGDIIICSEISRLGRDLYMVMDILHFAMKQECIIYTVKDKFTLGNDIQSKVLAFAFGLSAEIERQMIRQRTKEGLRQRMRMGVLLGRPPGKATREELLKYASKKNELRQQLEWGVPQRQIARNLGCDRNTVARLIFRWGFEKVCKTRPSNANWVKREKEANLKKSNIYKDTAPCIVELPREEVTRMIEQDLTIPQIAERLPAFTYEQVYDTILCNIELNNLYRLHSQLKVKKVHY